MKYSLRSLMIVVALGCVLLGGRIEYLRRMAVFHEQEASRLAERICDEQGLSRDELDFSMYYVQDPTSPIDLGVSTGKRDFIFHWESDATAYRRHRDLATAYRKCPSWRFGEPQGEEDVPSLLVEHDRSVDSEKDLGPKYGPLPSP